MNPQDIADLLDEPLPDEDELQYEYFVGATHAPNFVGPGYVNVQWNFAALEVL